MEEYRCMLVCMNMYMYVDLGIIQEMNPPSVVYNIDYCPLLKHFFFINNFHRNLFYFLKRL